MECGLVGGVCSIDPRGLMVVDEDVAVMWWRGLLGEPCPAPPRASPANIASLVRVPLRFAKGTFAPEPLGFWRLLVGFWVVRQFGDAVS